MGDWFETRFREPTDGGPLDPAFAARVRTLVVEEWRTGGGWTPSDDTDTVDPEGDIIMLQTEERPPTGDAPASRRRPPTRWLMAAAAAAAIAVVGALVVTGGDDEDKIDTAPVAPNEQPARDVMKVPGASTGFPPLEPGRYFVDPDGDASTSLRVFYEVPEGWSAWFGALKFNDDTHDALSITTVTNLVQDGCRDHSPATPAVGPTVDDLATALSQLAPFEVSSAPRDISLFGYSGKHLQLTIPLDTPSTGAGEDRMFSACVGESIHSWIAPNNGGSFYGYNGQPGRTEDFWILDVDGTRLVLITLTSPESVPQDLAELQAIFDSIQIEP